MSAGTKGRGEGGGGRQRKRGREGGKERGRERSREPPPWLLPCQYTKIFLACGASLRIQIARNSHRNSGRNPGRNSGRNSHRNSHRPQFTSELTSQFTSQLTSQFTSQFTSPASRWPSGCAVGLPAATPTSPLPAATKKEPSRLLEITQLSWDWNPGHPLCLVDFARGDPAELE